MFLRVTIASTPDVRGRATSGAYPVPAMSVRSTDYRSIRWHRRLNVARPGSNATAEVPDPREACLSEVVHHAGAAAPRTADNQISFVGVCLFRCPVNLPDGIQRAPVSARVGVFPSDRLRYVD